MVKENKGSASRSGKSKTFQEKPLGEMGAFFLIFALSFISSVLTGKNHYFFR